MSLRKGFFEYSLPENPLPQRFQNYRLNNKYTDVTIKVGDKLFPAHKMVLEDSSPVLKVLLSDTWLRENVCQFSEEFVSADIVEDLLNYFYLAKIVLTPENAHALCIASHYLGIQNLLSISEKYLSKQISPTNVLELFLFANRLELKFLQKFCVKLIFQTNNGELLKDSKLTNFTKENLDALIVGLSKLKLSKELEKAMFESLLTWTEFDCSRRLSLLPALLKHIRFDALSETYLQNFTGTSTSISNVLNEFIDDTFQLEHQELQATEYPLTSAINFGQKLFHLKVKERAIRENDPLHGERDLKSYTISVFKFNPVNTEMQELFTDREFHPWRGHTVTVVNDKLYFYREEYSNSEPIYSMEMFDCSSSTWKKLSSMPGEIVNSFEYMSKCKSIASKNSIFITKDENNFGKGDELVKYSIQNDEWTKMQSMLTNRMCYALAELNGFLYAIGGYILTGDWTYTRLVERYNPETDQWQFVANLNYYHHPRTNSDAMSFAGKVYIIGSRGFEAYTPENDRWKPLKTLDNYRRNTLVVFDNKLCAVGKNGGDNWTMFEFDIFLEEWLELANVDNTRLQDVMNFDAPVFSETTRSNEIIVFPTESFLSSSGQQSFSVPRFK